MLVTDEEYPVRPAFSLLMKTLEDFTAKVPQESYSNPSSISFPEIQEYLRTYQDPKQADTIMRVQQELDETKIVLHKTIESVLARGERLDDLVVRSDALSAQSKRFYTTAKRVSSIRDVLSITNESANSMIFSKTLAASSCRRQVRSALDK